MPKNINECTTQLTRFLNKRSYNIIFKRRDLKKFREDANVNTVR